MEINTKIGRVYLYKDENEEECNVQKLYDSDKEYISSIVVDSEEEVEELIFCLKKMESVEELIELGFLDNIIWGKSIGDLARQTGLSKHEFCEQYWFSKIGDYYFVEVI